MDVKNIFKGEQNCPKQITIEQYNKELEEAEKQIEAGNFMTQEELEKEIEEW